MRWLTPTLLLAAAVYLWHFNSTHTARKLLFPGVELLAGPDVETQAALSWMLFAALGLVTALIAVAQRPRNRE